MTYEQNLRQGGDCMLREASAYFAGQGRLHDTLRKLFFRLDAEGIVYALPEGLALAQHGYPRLTEDIVLLLAPAGLAQFREQLVGRGYWPAFSRARKTICETETGVRFEILTTVEYPGDGLPKSVSFPDPSTPGVAVERNDIQIATLETLIEMKPASGTSASRRLRDLADGLDSSVQEVYQDL